MKTFTRCLVLSLAVLAAPAFAQDESGGKLNQRFWVQLGAFHPHIDSHGQSNSTQSGAAGTDLDFENELGLPDKKTLPTLLLGARLGDRWRSEFEYFRLKRSGLQTLSTDVQYDDTVYHAQASLSSEFESSVYRLSAGYSFYKTPEAEAGVVLGLHVTDFKIALDGEGTVNGGTVASRTEHTKKLVPLPTLGAYGTYAFASDWMVGGRVDWLSLKVGDYKGRLLNLQGNVYYRFTPNVALGLGYRYDDYKVDVSRTDLNGTVKYRFSGPQLVLDAGF